MKTNEMFQFLEQLFQNAFHVDCFFLQPPYQNLKIIDRGFRSMVWKDFSFDNSNIESFLNSSPKINHIISSHSNLDFFNVLVMHKDFCPEGFFSIGPFTDHEISNVDINRIMSENHLPTNQLVAIRQFYRTLPIVNVDDLLHTLQQILCMYYPDFASTEITNISYTEENHEFAQNQERYFHFSYEYAEKFSLAITQFVKELRSGNTDSSYEKIRDLLDISGSSFESSSSKIRHQCYNLNTLCCLALQDSHVHPYYLFQQANYFSNLIQHEHQKERLLQLAYEMTRKYTLLVKNYSHHEYSLVTRKAIQYIQLHITEEITLSRIAGALGKNPSYLSMQFKKETSQTITDFIHRERIQLSVQYLNSSSLSIQEIAILCGFNDYTYFCKIFKKMIGDSPSHYRKVLLS